MLCCYRERSSAYSKIRHHRYLLKVYVPVAVLFFVAVVILSDLCYSPPVQQFIRICGCMFLLSVAVLSQSCWPGATDAVLVLLLIRLTVPVAVLLSVAVLSQSCFRVCLVL